MIPEATSVLALGRCGIVEPREAGGVSFVGLFRAESQSDWQTQPTALLGGFGRAKSDSRSI